MSLTLGGLFSGIGGFELAAQSVGIDVRWICEIDKFCQGILRKTFKGVTLYDDVRELQAIDDLERVDIITGGFPCQPFSVAGQRRGKEDDRDLWPAMFAVIKAVRPTWVVGENVAGFVRMELDRTISDLEGAGYACRAFIIPACAVGAPHRRDRVWIVAHSSSSQDEQRERRSVAEAAGAGRREHTAAGAGRADVANAHSERQQQPRWPEREEWRRAGNSGAAVPNAIGSGRQKQRGAEQSKKEQPWAERRCWWPPEPGVGRVVNGLPHRVDRLRALGNAIVPQVAERIFTALLQPQAEEVRG